MKVLQVNTKDTGGAGIAAIRLHKALLKININSHFLFLNSISAGVPARSQFVRRKPKSVIAEALLNKLGLNKDVGQLNKAKLRKLPKDYEMFSFAETGIDITESPFYQEADIIHLHWVPRFLDYPSFFKKNTKPVVWTLHDMNPFSGGFHYEGDFINNRDHFFTLNQEILNTKANALKNFKDLYIVTPSKWLLNISSKSELLGKYSHYHIPNGIDQSIFKIYDKSFARSVFNLPSDKKIILFISESLDNKRKGFDLLLEAVNGLSSEEMLLCAVGKHDNVEGHENIFHINGVSDERLMALLYNAADAFILPSREDNLPNVMIEALACATPVISFTVGGIPEVITTGFNGILAPELTADALKTAIKNFLVNEYSFDRDNIRKFARRNFDSVDQAKKYITLYENILIAQ